MEYDEPERQGMLCDSVSESEVMEMNDINSNHAASVSRKPPSIKLQNKVVPSQQLTDEVQFAESCQEKKSCWSKFKRFLSASRNWIGVILARILFLVLAILSIGVAVSAVISTNQYVSLLFVPIILLIFEFVVTLKFKGCKEWKWATPCIFAYLMCTIPPIWIMEYKGYERRMENAKNNYTTDIVCSKDLSDFSDSFHGVELNDKADVGRLASTSLAAAEKLCLCFDCAPYMEQIMLFSLIIGRWILPKAKGISTDQKAQLLLVNIAVAADILELYELMKEDTVNMDLTKIIIVLSVWSFSLLQFGIVSTATTESTVGCCCSCFATEMWSLVTLLCMDDLSFLLLRLTFAIKFKIISYSSLFFVSKNCLVLILDLNRIIALHNETRKVKKSNLHSVPSITRIRR